jgi:hypothetical protein
MGFKNLEGRNGAVGKNFAVEDECTAYGMVRRAE